MKYCPCCSTELISQDDVHICPRNEIGDGYEQSHIEYHQLKDYPQDSAFDIAEIIAD
ncbi:Cysteine-rich CPCC protein [Vibrio crassostreae]|uniref:hypothetical protein n=1 Tax=Vibrio crassostreae TaxID=246167 RepID=UPI001B31750C|nr:hypothetical protein [Vibrio crassostreae]CAK1846661.1 Cysteine-rich CPCC protein [Vibrio crassostreae]CAK1848696.1 Cysteine-rich CPCC protein [Vibrio crassostreae]CAK1850908.1 Cysteine-rich CPCC protein [Vibrio crassostreae]CAK1851727.1 Cysteine-rich CPCC protein [Vibrio crassostreae]CAK1851745.1 Cysteine-rich CPCC protein [Vibrio crassostreae]